MGEPNKKLQFFTLEEHKQCWNRTKILEKKYKSRLLARTGHKLAGKHCIGSCGPHVTPIGVIFGRQLEHQLRDSPIRHVAAEDHQNSVKMLVNSDGYVWCMWATRHSCRLYFWSA